MSCHAIQCHGVINMLMTVIPALLSLCAIGLVLLGIGEALFAKSPKELYHIVPLSGDGGEAEQLVRWALRSLKGRVYFVDCGLEARGQMTVELLLRHRDGAVLCAWEQIFEELRGKDDLGSGTD